jgi:hypothetical protein
MTMNKACSCCQPSPLSFSSVKDSIDTDRPAGIPSYLKPVRLNGPDAEDVLKSFLRRNEKKVYRPLLNLWKKQRAAWTTESVKDAMLTGELPADIEEQWTKEYEEIVAEVIEPVMLAGALRGATYMDESMTNALGGKGLLRGRELKEVDESATATAVNARATLLAVDFSRGAAAAAGVSLRSLIDAGASESDIRFIMRGIVGLSPDRAADAIKRYHVSLAAGTPKGAAQSQFIRDANRARDVRATNISRSELAAAFNGGANGQVNTVIDTGVLIGDRVVKQFLTVGDERVCIICEPLDGKIVGFESPLLADPTTRYFSYQAPPLHWGCRCVIIYVTYL